MKFIKRLIFLSISIILFNVNSSLATKTSSTGSGNWNNSGIWDNGVPTCGDTVFISVNDTVIITSNVNLDEASTPACSTSMYIQIDGILGFQTGKKLYIPCGSGVYISSTGDLLKGSGGGSSNLIEVCGTGIWDAGDGNVGGPQWVGAPLPITLKYFTAASLSEVVQLNWVTLSEINNEQFIIEKSENLKTVIEVTSIPGAGNSSSELLYESFDLHPSNGTSYYRLKQVDFDGSVTYHEWTAINVNQSRANNVLVQPTIVESEFHITIKNHNESLAQVSLHNSHGSLISKKELNISSDNFVWSSTNDMLQGNGTMFLSVLIDGKEYQFKLIFK